MISADDQFAVLRVRAAEWSFTGARDIAVTLVTADGTEREPAAAVHGKDLIDIAFGTAPERMAELAAFEPSRNSHRRNRGPPAARGPFRRFCQPIRDCLAGIGQAAKLQIPPQIHAAVR